MLLVFSLVFVVCFAVYCLLFDVAVCRPLEPPHISQKTKAKGVNSARGRGWAYRKKGMECRERETGDNDCDGYVDVEKSNFPVELTNGERALP